MKAVIAKVTDCNVNVNWEAPDSRGQPITNYYVEIKGKDGKFYPVNSGVKATFRSLQVPMSNLTKKPFNLIRGQKIAARVSA